MGLYFGVVVIIISVVVLLCNYFYIKGYKDCFRDQKINKEFGENVESLKCYIIRNKEHN